MRNDIVAKLERLLREVIKRERFIKSVELITTGIHPLVKNRWKSFLCWKITLKNDELRYLMCDSEDPSVAWVTRGE